MLNYKATITVLDAEEPLRVFTTTGIVMGSTQLEEEGHNIAAYFNNEYKVEVMFETRATNGTPLN
jgi:hypothetical protein